MKWSSGPGRPPNASPLVLAPTRPATPGFAEEDRQEIQQETQQQDALLDQIGDAVQELHAMSKVGGPSWAAGGRGGPVGKEIWCFCVGAMRLRAQRRARPQPQLGGRAALSARHTGACWACPIWPRRFVRVSCWRETGAWRCVYL